MSNRSDIEATRLCALAMGWGVKVSKDTKGQDRVLRRMPQDHMQDCWCDFDPLHDDAHAMALVKKLGISLRQTDPDMWDAWVPLQPADGSNTNLNRAIVECAAAIAATSKTTSG